jgi:hypothetical protein
MVPSGGERKGAYVPQGWFTQGATVIRFARIALAGLAYKTAQAQPLPYPKPQRQQYAGSSGGACEKPLMIKPVATFATLLMVLMPAAATPMPAVKSAQCAPGHMVSGGFCAPLFRMPPAAVLKVMHCPNRLMQRGSSSCLEMPRR